MPQPYTTMYSILNHAAEPESVQSASHRDREMKFLMLQSSSSYCVHESKPCLGWAETYFSDCLCNVRDELSFGLGLISLFFWAVAEFPQIFTNYRTKSAHGVSLILLLTWILGDVFNFVGCLLDPATLPTQLYTALLYTVNAHILVFQSLYYGYFIKWRVNKPNQEAGEAKTPLLQRKHVQIPRLVGFAAFIAASFNKPHVTLASMEVRMRSSGRKLLQEHATDIAYGELSGWMMAAIYMGSRIPQICLNIKRRSVEGLNPLMFVFALAANATYVASILVRSTAWDEVRPNMPWLLDGVGCATLDIFIMLQCVYYRNCWKKSCSSGEENDQPMQLTSDGLIL